MAIIVLKGISQNNVLREFSDAIAEGLRKIDQTTFVTDLTLQSGFDELNALLQREEVEGIVSFNAILGETLPDHFKIPFICWLVDAPHYHFKRLNHTGGNRHYIFPSKHHANYLVQGKIKASSSTQLAGARHWPAEVKPHSQRNHTLLLAASWMGEPQPFWANYTQDIAKQVAQKIVALLDADPRVDALKACMTAARALGIEFKLNDSWAELASQAQSYIRQKDRLRVVETLAQTGVPMTLIGKGWESNMRLGSHVNVIDDLDHKNILAYYADAKVVINLNAANGASERLFDAMSMGACVISDHSDTLLSLFKDRKDFCVFDRRRENSLSEALHYALRHDRAESMSRRATQMVSQQHLWEHRAAMVVNLLQAMRPA